MSDDTPKAYICGIGMVTAVGDSAAMTAASVHAGINRYKETNIYNKNICPMKMALLPDEVLVQLNDKLVPITNLTSRQQRMLGLAQPAMIEALSNLSINQDIPLYIAVPETIPKLPATIGAEFLDYLHVQCDSMFDREHSMMYTTGRAGGLIAVEAAINSLAHNSHGLILVGGLDSYLDLMLLGTLDNEDRVLADGILNGFAPGEGAGFLLLANEQALHTNGLQSFATIYSAGITTEPGHRYSKEPYQGTGLADAFNIALENVENTKIKTIFSSMNGENFGAKEYGVALIRNSEKLDASVKLEHPSDCYGDIGAASAPVLLGLTSIGLNKGYIQGPVLVYCSSEGEYRGAACINVNS